MRHRPSFRFPVPSRAAAPVAVLVAVVGLIAPPVRADEAAPPPSPPTPLEVGGFAFEIATTVPVPPTEAFDAFTGDITGWWDHSFADPAPKSMVIEPRPGGAFLEIFDDEGNGAKHAEVIFVKRGERLILRGPLGLTGNATDFVFDLRFEPADDDGTTVRLLARAAGQMDASWGPIVQSVWRHFLVERYRPWVEGGHHRTR